MPRSLIMLNYAQALTTRGLIESKQLQRLIDFYANCERLLHQFLSLLFEIPLNHT